jgi:hypothetical protein
MSLSNEALLRAISADRALASSVCFPHRHPQATPPFHIQIVDLWRAADEFVAIQAFREAAKSTLSEEFLTLEGEFANSPYTLIIGETFTKGCERLDSIANELLTNEKLRQLFGRAKGDTWNENFIILANGAAIQAAGWDQELRGFNHRGVRPYRAYLDDIENKERVRDTTTVEANWRRIWGELMPALDKKHRKLRITGTPLADDCIMKRCAADPSFVSGFFPICDGDIDDENTKSLWPERYPMEWIRAERDRYARAGALPEFFQEYMLVSVQTQSKPFSADQIRYVEVAPAKWAPKKAIIDPARTVDIRSSAQTGHVVVSRIGTTLYVHESGGDFWQPSQIVEHAFDTNEKFACEVCIEKNGLDEWLLQPIRAESLRRGKALPVRAIQAPQDRDKDQFILGLQPFARAGDIVLIGDRVKHAALAAQISNFPAGKKDIINALAYAVRVFGGESVYSDFSEANMVPAIDPALGSVLYVSATGDGALTCAVLAAIEGQSVSVLADWATNIPATDALMDIALVVRASYPMHRINAIVPATIYDQEARSPIMRTLRDRGLRVYRGGFEQANRASLTHMIRTEMRGKRQLRVDTAAVNTLQALAGSYQYEIGKGAKQGCEPLYGIYRFIGEAVENLTSAIVSTQSEALPEGAKTAMNPQGTKYITSLPNRQQRR